MRTLTSHPPIIFSQCLDTDVGKVACLPWRTLPLPAGMPRGGKLGVGAKTVYGAPQFRVLHWVKASRGSGTVWCDVADPLPGLPQPYSSALEKLFGVKPAVKPAAGMS